MRWVASEAFPIEFAIAQMNQVEFYGNLALEMETMMKCCDYVNPYWGVFDINRLSESEVEKISQAVPYENIRTDYMKSTGNDTSGMIEREIIPDRSESEVGTEWISTQQLDELLRDIQERNQNSSSPASPVAQAPTNHETGENLNESLLSQDDVIQDKDLTESRSLSSIPLSSSPSSQEFISFWREKLIVRVMSGRNHDYGNPLVNTFYTQQMKNLAGAEHVLHSHLAKDGKRRVYPHLNHMKMFSQIHEILFSVREINERLESDRLGV